jgi:hypothetical protein
VVADEPRSCPACGSANAAVANFCANCGHRLAEETEGSVAYTTAPPRLFGVLSPIATFVLGCVLLLGALVVFAAGSWILGILFSAIAVAVLVLFFGAAERDPSSSIARAALTARNRLRDWAGFATGSAGAWTKAGRDVFRIKREVWSLRSERDRAQLALGDAAYREDESATASLRVRMQEIDAAISSRERERADALAHARRRVADERVAGQPTEQLSTEDLRREDAETSPRGGSGPDPPPSR